MTSKEIRQKFLQFFKKRGHKIVPSSSLLPKDDPSVLLTTAGMQQFKPYYVGQKDAAEDFGAYRLASSQKCFRTSDIDEVGDESHLTFFEMLGNFSFGYPIAKGSYFKKEAIEAAYEFIAKEMNLEIDYVTVFKGDAEVPYDAESFEIWKNLGMPEEKIKKRGREENFWGPTGEQGPCGPTTEIYIAAGEKSIEIWNLVFNEFYKYSDGRLEPLAQKGVDTGMGLERLAIMKQEVKTVFETDLFTPIIATLKNIAPKKDLNARDLRHLRIIADHLKGASFLITDGVLPSNLGAGYVLRRILRKLIRYAKALDLPADWFVKIFENVSEIYRDVYPHTFGDAGSYQKNIVEGVGVYPELKNKQSKILTVIKNEEEKFSKALEKGTKEFEKLAEKIKSAAKSGQAAGGDPEHREISGADAFVLFETYGFPLELTGEMAAEKGIAVDEKGFWEEFKKHQEISRAGAEKKFGGHGLFGRGGKAGAEFSAEEKEKAVKLHTATHLLHAALRKILGDGVQQMGSDINPERLRFDFKHPAKMTADEIKKVEDLVNRKISENLPVKKETMTFEEAVKSGALAFFKEKYPETVAVYSAGDFSKEICGGPHVPDTGEIGKFKITKEESSSAGVRRIKAILESSK